MSNSKIKIKNNNNRKMFRVLITIAVLLLLLNSVATVTMERSTFRAAVYGHAVILPQDSSVVISRQEALANMEKNLEVYSKQAMMAKQQGADIIVFPEDGLYGFLFKRETIFPYLEYIPDPSTERWSPCSDPDRYSDSDVQRSLSCMAKDNRLYIVANMGDKQPCDVMRDRKCPPDGRYQYNTNVVFGPDGTLLARYHKYHLFYEAQFDVPELELIYFDTPFGRFGLMVCFDVLFHDPGLPLIETLKIRNIVFPTAWMDALPLLSALGFHSSFARGLGVNFLSANIHLPGYRFHGSGIYGPNGAIKSYYGASNTSEPKLLVADVKVLGKSEPSSQFYKMLDCTGTCEKETNSNIYEQNMKESNKKSFNSFLFYDLFTFVTLDQPSGKLQISQNSISCNLQYSISDDSFGKELFAFGAFDGLHTYEGQYYFQICALVKCADARNRSSCGAVTSTTETFFTHLSMTATLETRYIYPQIVLSDRSGELRLAEADSWTFNRFELKTNEAFNDTIHSAALFGRFYSRDNVKDDVGEVYEEETELDDFSGKSKLSSNENLVFIFGVAFQLIVLSFLLL